MEWMEENEKHKIKEIEIIINIATKIGWDETIIYEIKEIESTFKILIDKKLRKKYLVNK